MICVVCYSLIEFNSSPGPKEEACIHPGLCLSSESLGGEGRGRNATCNGGRAGQKMKSSKEEQAPVSEVTVYSTS